MSLKHRACHTFTISKQDNKTSVENTSKSSRDAGHLDGKSSKTVQILPKATNEAHNQTNVSENISKTTKNCQTSSKSVPKASKRI